LPFCWNHGSHSLLNANMFFLDSHTVFHGEQPRKTIIFPGKTIIFPSKTIHTYPFTGLGATSAPKKRGAEAGPTGHRGPTAPVPRSQTLVYPYPIGSMVLLYMVLHGSHQYTPFMLAYIPAPWIRHGICMGLFNIP
jgi:hypothetical protein